jgi:tetratricopeptide (TPR) repeat protein
MAELTAGLEDARAGRGSLFLVTGEPGVGKTRLAEELSARAPDLGVRTLWGRCWDAGGAPAYWPWIHVIRELIRGLDTDTLAELMGPGASSIAQMVRELYQRLPNLREPPPAESERARFFLFDATTTFLRNAASSEPLLVLIDDLNAADLSSVLLLRFLAGALQDARIMLLGTYRDRELRRRPEIGRAVGDLVRAGRSIPLAGWSSSEVENFIERTWGRPSPPDIVAAVVRTTEGNPFFVDEVLRTMRVEDGQGSVSADRGRLGVPEGVRHAIRQRLTSVGERVEEILEAASVIGREFDLHLLEQACGIPQPELLELLGEAEAADILTEIPSVPGRFEFAHGLIRETLHDDIPAVRRRRLHILVAQALSSTIHHHADPHTSELAHHWFEALPIGDASKAVDYAVRAGERAMAQLAYSEAAFQYERALQALALKGSPDEAARCELLLSLATALRRAGEATSAREIFARAAECARGLSAPEQLARAALGYGGEFAEEGIGLPGSVDEALVALVEEALAGLPSEPSSFRARLLARLAVALYWTGAPERVAALGREAAAIAEQTGDPTAQSAAVYGMRYALWGPDHLDERLAAAAEILRVATEAGDRERIQQARRWRVTDLLEAGDVAGFDREVLAHEQLATELREPLYMWHASLFRAMRAVMTGPLSEAGRLVEDALAAGQRAESPFASALHAAQTIEIMRLRGQLGAIEGVLQEYVARLPAVPVVRAVYSDVLCGIGRIVEARAEFERLAAHDFADMRRSYDWPMCMLYLSQACAALGDTARAATLYRLLLPYEHRSIVTGIPACVWLGPVSRLLGLLAATTGSAADAVRHLEDGIAFADAAGARLLASQTRFELARVLLDRAEPGDRERARGLLADAEASARNGGTALEGPASALLASLDEEPEPAPIESPVAVPFGTSSGVTAGGNVFRREGEYWTIAFEGALLRLKDSKGLRYIAHLLRSPGEELHSVELVTAVAGPPGASYAGAEPGLRPASGDGGEVLDQQAKAAYRARLTALEEELEEARSWGDAERGAKAQAEIEAVSRELARALGLAGRDRRVSSDAERARINVTRAIKAALDRIAEACPALGRHLALTLKTGAFCRYAPDPRAEIPWSF